MRICCTAQSSNRANPHCGCLRSYDCHRYFGCSQNIWVLGIRYKQLLENQDRRFQVSKDAAGDLGADRAFIILACNTICSDWFLDKRIRAWSAFRQCDQSIHANRLRMLVAALDSAQAIQDMSVPGFKLHPLKGGWRVGGRYP